MTSVTDIYLESTKDALHSIHCKECSHEALGRCPDCHKRFCQDHFPKQQHAPCAEKQAERAAYQHCYVCNEQVYPTQWSLSKTTHFVDQATCTGCGRYICNDAHTKKKGTLPKIVLDGAQSHRYEFVQRYCDLCTPVSALGGLKGTGYWIAGLTTLILFLGFIIRH